MCKTNPISPGAAGLQERATREECAKRTQFAHVRQVGGAGLEQFLQNKPNLEGERVKRTQFLAVSVERDRRGVGHEANVQNEPNFCGGRPRRLKPVVRNKANSRTSETMGKCFMEKKL